MKEGIKKFIKNMLSGTGDVSAKRVSGMSSMTIALLCIIYLVIKEGGNSVTESLLETALIISACLLGVTSVTGIWKGKKFKKE